MFASHPNIIPIAVTTGVGPQGAKTIWYQPRDDDIDGTQPNVVATHFRTPDALIDPVLHNITQSQLSQTQAVTTSAITPVRASLSSASAVMIGSEMGSSDDITLTPRPPLDHARPPKPSTASRPLLDKIKVVVPQKRTIVESMLDMSK